MAECDMSGCNGMARPVICEGHAKQAHEVVQSLPVYYVRLHGALAPSKVTGEHVSGTRSPKAAMAMPVWSLMEDMVSVSSQWARLAREHRQVAPLAPLRRPGPSLALAVESLLRHDETLLKLSVAGEYARDMRRLQTRADVLLKADRLIHRLDAPCPACELRVLFRKDGDGYVVCASCGASWDEQAYTRLVRVLVWQLQTMENHA